MENQFNWDSELVVDGNLEEINEFVPATEQVFKDLEKEEEGSKEKKEEDVKKEKEEENIKDIFEEEEEEQNEQEVPLEISSIFNKFKSLDLVDDLEEGEELTEDLLKEKIEAKKEKEIKELFEEMPQEAKAFNKFVLNGGNPLDFIKAFKEEVGTVISFKDLDMTKEENQRLVLEQSLKDEGLDDDDIKAQIDFYKESGKLEKMSLKKQELKIKQQEEIAETLADAQEQRQKDKQIKDKKYKETLSNIIVEKKEINGLNFSDSDMKSLPSDLTEKTVKLENGQKITKFNKDLLEAIANPETALQIAKLLKMRDNKGLINFETIINTGRTKENKAFKEDIKRSKSSTPSKSTSTSFTKTKSLADYF